MRQLLLIALIALIVRALSRIAAELHRLAQIAMWEYLDIYTTVDAVNTEAMKARRN